MHKTPAGMNSLKERFAGPSHALPNGGAGLPNPHRLAAEWREQKRRVREFSRRFGGLSKGEERWAMAGWCVKKCLEMHKGGPANEENVSLFLLYVRNLANEAGSYIGHSERTWKIYRSIKEKESRHFEKNMEKVRSYFAEEPAADLESYVSLRRQMGREIAEACLTLMRPVTFLPLGFEPFFRKLGKVMLLADGAAGLRRNWERKQVSFKPDIRAYRTLAGEIWNEAKELFRLVPSGRALDALAIAGISFAGVFRGRKDDDAKAGG